MLGYENIDSNADPGQKLWVYKIRNHEMDTWKGKVKRHSLLLVGAPA